jgi:hypothetical protein
MLYSKIVNPVALPPGCARLATIEAGEPAEGEQRLTDGAGGSMHEHALASLHLGRAV